MNKSQFRKITSRILRHSGFQVKMNKETHEYEFVDSTQQIILYCKPIIIEEEEVENYLCFRVISKLTEDNEKLYNRMINRFTRLAPSININFEDESEPIFTETQLEKIDEILNEYETTGAQNEE